MMESILAILVVFYALFIVTNSERLTFLGGKDSWAVYKGLNARERATLNFQFKTNSSQGNVIHIQGKSEETYLKLRLHNGKLVLKVAYFANENNDEELGSDLNDLLWHNVTIIRNHRATIFELDGAQQLISKLHWKKVLDVKEDIYIGNHVNSQGAVNTGDNGFIGCIQNFKFGQGYQDLKKRSPRRIGSKTKFGCMNYCNKEGIDLYCNNKGRTVNGFRDCVCDCFGTGFKGSHCEKASPVISLRSNMDFISKSVVALSRRKFNKVQLRFKTRQKDGIILTLGNLNAYLTLELLLGRVRLEANVGAGKIVMMSSYELDDGVWHDVQIKQHIASFTMIVDDRKVTRFEETKDSPYGQGDTGCGTSDIAYFGGHFNPITVTGSESRQGFVGCLQQLQFYMQKNIIEDIIEEMKSNETSDLDYEIDGKVEKYCDIVPRPVAERKPQRKTKPPLTTASPKLITQGNNEPAAFSIQQKEPDSKTRTGKKLNKNSVAWITAGIVIGTIVLLLALALIIHRFRKKYRGSFMAPRDENGVPYYSSVQSSYQSHSNGTSRKHRGNATDV